MVKRRKIGPPKIWGLWGIILALFLFGCGPRIPVKSDHATPALDQKPAASMTFSANSTLFEIEPSGSEARFLIDEILQGEEKRVIGKTNQVSGQIAVDFDNPPSSAVGPVKINALTIETDSAFRNRAIQSRILLANIYEFITFTPLEIKNLPEEIVLGDQLNFQVAGDLTITAYTQPVVFDVTVTPISESQLEGQATAVIDRTDFDLRIPSAPGVAGVSEMVTLQLDFTATAVLLSS